MKTVLTPCVLAALIVASPPAVVHAQSYPRTLAATADAAGPGGSLTGKLTIHVDHLMTDRDFKRVADALKFGGYPKFLPALRQLPMIGYVEAGGRQVEIKYARVRAADKRLVIGTDQPIYFVGAGSPEAKPRAGYELAVIELDVDPQGNGQGTMAAAARVKPAADGGVVLDDYATTPIRLSVAPAK